MTRRDVSVMAAPAAAVLILAVAIRLAVGPGAEPEPAAMELASAPMTAELPLGGATFRVDLDHRDVNLLPHPTPAAPAAQASVGDPAAGPAEPAEPGRGKVRVLLEMEDGAAGEAPREWSFETPGDLSNFDVNVTVRNAAGPPPA